MLEPLSSSVHSSQPRTANQEGTNIITKKEGTNEITANANAVKNKEYSKQEIEEVVDSLNKFLQPSHTSIKFEFHEKLNEYYVTVVDDTTQETIKEIPSKKILDFYAAMTEFVGIMVDKRI
ncbi:flagellar protein FlaG [Bacillus sp. V5-8f]|uniref:flagellar protein FlaG n=1 Tax=Bacillus sp. V5-8f TaxID=2053044 RepID=UPI0021556AE7|nr:flagellar protein FlaG [Bacillus sp. V5-8f]